MSRHPLLRALLLLLAAVVPRLGAQLPLPSASLVAGVSRYQLDGSGSTPIGALRVELPLLVVIAEGSLGVFRPAERSGTHTYLVPEAQLQWQLFPLLVRPYVGLGGGLVQNISGPGERSSRVTGSASLGARVGVPLIGAGLRAELRVRGIGAGFGGRAAELTAGVSL